MSFPLTTHLFLLVRVISDVDKLIDIWWVDLLVLSVTAQTYKMYIKCTN